MPRVPAVLVGILLMAGSAQASLVMVDVRGTVAFNGVPDPPLSDINLGEQVILSFAVDSDNFVDGNPGDTRGYEIDQSSFSLGFSSGLSLGLLDPVPSGQTPYLTLVEGFPVSDGFFVSTSPFSPGGVPLEQDPIQMNLDLGYDGASLTSLDILDALGVYGLDGLTRFGFNLWRVFPDNVVMGIEFQQLTITGGPLPVAPSSCSRVKAMFR